MFTGYDDKKIIKIANIWQSYSKNKSGLFFWLTVYMFLHGGVSE